MASSTVFLDLLGPQRASEKGTTCPGDLPPASDPELVERARAARAALGERAFVLGHHYQRDEVIQFADARGDSFRLAQQAAARPEAEFVVFCGVHFMAESADILTGEHQQVILPDLAAGCSMADMATWAQVDEAWEILQEWVPGGTVPLTYMNSSAAIKAFTGREGGAICTSSNAATAMAWAFERAERVLFLPDQHLGRNTALAMGLDAADCVVWDPHRVDGGLDPDRARAAKVVLWRGHCSVHHRFLPEHVDRVRERIPGVRVLVHPECRHDVVAKADEVGSTERIIKVVAASPPGSSWAIGTELNLVHRLATEHPDKTIAFLDRTVCFCSTMNRIDLPHLTWALEELVAGRVPNRVAVDEATRAEALVALERMLALPG
jgi:quinolinate synthase